MGINQMRNDTVADPAADFRSSSISRAGPSKIVRVIQVLTQNVEILRQDIRILAQKVEELAQRFEKLREQTFALEALNGPLKPIAGPAWTMNLSAKMTITFRKCTSCGAMKPLEDFYPRPDINHPQRRHRQCKDCQATKSQLARARRVDQTTQRERSLPAG